jgi:N6-adenosine-specific RNA methylase IME4
MDIIKFQKATFERNKLVIHDDITLDEWKQLGQGLKQVEGSVQFWIGDWARFGDKKGFTGKYTDSKVYDELEEITGLERQTIQQYKSVASKLDTNLRSPELSFNHHREVASLAPEKQKQFLDRASEQKLSVRELREEIRKEEYKEPEMPTDKYRVFYADPPWKYNDKCETGAIQSGGADKHYPTLSIEELCGLPIDNLSEPNAILFLWTTSPMLEDAFTVVSAWGFKYKASFVWDKVKHNMGHYNSVRHEFLLVCTKGSCTPDKLELFDSVQSIEKSDKHSEKPEEFRRIIDTLYPNGKRIELFARMKKEGWDTYGNEL